MTDREEKQASSAWNREQREKRLEQVRRWVRMNPEATPHDVRVRWSMGHDQARRVIEEVRNAN